MSELRLLRGTWDLGHRVGLKGAGCMALGLMLSQRFLADHQGLGLES